MFNVTLHGDFDINVQAGLTAEHEDYAVKVFINAPDFSQVVVSSIEELYATPVFKSLGFSHRMQLRSLFLAAVASRHWSDQKGIVNVA